MTHFFRLQRRGIRGQAPSRTGRRARAVILAIVVAVSATPAISHLFAQQRQAVFRAGTAIVSVDVIVRDSAGNIVRGLTAKDFSITEDGKAQQIDAFTFEEISDAPAASVSSAGLLGDVDARLRDDVRRAAGVTPPPAATVADPNTDFANRRLLVLLFDISSMQPEDVQRAVDSGTKYVNTSMSGSDLVAVVTIGTKLTVLNDFTNDKDTVRRTLQQMSYTDGTSTPPAGVSTLTTDEAAAAGDTTTDDTSGFESFNNDVRLRALKALAETLGPIEQKKAILYFSAGMQRNGDDNQIELRAAINAAVRGNVVIYPVDARGLQAVVPGGDASRPSGRGAGLFSGQSVQSQFSAQAASQGSLVSLAADTGGRAFTDSNDFGEAFARAQRDLSAYYLLGYSSPNNSQDGRFRRIQVKVNGKNLRVESRAGYYADRDFTHTNTRDREALLEEQLTAAVSSTDVPVVVGTGWFRQSSDRYYVPIALAVPGSFVPVASGADKATVDVRGVVRDEQGRPVSRIKETLSLPSGGADTLAGKQVLYQSGVSLPPGRFSVKVVVRENAGGAIGSFEAPILVPQLRDDAIKLSSVVLSTQLQPATRAVAENPLIRDGVQLLPNLTRVVTRGQNAYFYFEVYDPALAQALPHMRTSLAFYRNNVKVFETPVVERATIDDPARKAVVFQYQVPATSFTPGAYTCQINVIDTVASKVAFPRLSFLVREK